MFSAYSVITFLQYKIWDKDYILTQANIVVQLHKSVILLQNVHFLRNTTDLHVFQVQSRYKATGLLCLSIWGIRM